MVDEIINGLYHTSFSVSFLIIAVIAARYLLRKAPRYITCFLWLFVGIRLLCPIPIESTLSLVPSQPAIIQNPAGLQAGQGVISPVKATEKPQDIEQEIVPIQNISPKFDEKEIAVFIWVTGIVLLMGYSAVSYVRLKRRVRFAIPAEGPEGKIYECGTIDTPFLLGFIRPHIYIPERMDEKSLMYVIAHERAHISRGDHLMKAAGYLLLAFYWFHPLVWISYGLLCRDIEQACDEKVIRMMGLDCKRAYSEALLKCAVKRNSMGACPVAFGEGEVKSRVKNILNYRKPAVWAVAAAVLVCIFVGVCFMTQQKGSTKTVPDQEQIRIFVNQWANAYVSRNALSIVEMSSENVKEQLKEKDLLEMGEDYVSFGLSSPWPMEDGEGNGVFEIINISANRAEIIYYALASDPHVFVWRETLVFEAAEGGSGYIVTEENMEYMDAITDAGQFYRAYPDGDIAGTWMDYQQNGLGEALNRNAVENRESPFYKELFEPETAALYLLNIKTGANVKTSIENSQAENARVRILFTADESTVEVNMAKPYGDGGIWIMQAQDVKSEILEASAKNMISSLDELDTISTYFEDPHGDTMMEQQADLDQDGADEIITLEDAGAQGGDGGYYVHVYRVVDGERKEIVLPSIYEEKFPFAALWNKTGAEIMLGNESIVQIPGSLVKEMYEKRTTPESIELPEEEESIAGDFVSGFAVITNENGDTQLVLKSYLGGIHGHADCFGYGIVKLQLSGNNTWKMAYEFVLDEDDENRLN